MEEPNYKYTVLTIISHEPPAAPDAKSESFPSNLAFYPIVDHSESQTELFSSFAWHYRVR